MDCAWIAPGSVGTCTWAGIMLYCTVRTVCAYTILTSSGSSLPGPARSVGGVGSRTRQESEGERGGDVWMAWVAWTALDGLNWTAETQDFYPYRVRVGAGVFACSAYRETGGRDL